MKDTNIEFFQLLNTAIIKSKEKKLNYSYEDKLKNICSSPVIKSLNIAIKNLSETENVSYDQATSMLINSIKELDSVWHDYVLLEGIGNIKKLLKKDTLSQ